MSASELEGEVVAEGSVLPEWIDANGHMNVAYYVLAFDLAVDTLWSRFGITDEYIETTRGSTFAVECHITYQDELLRGDPYLVTAQILAYDEKRIHQFQRLYHGETGRLAATAEWMNLHVDLDERRVTPWPPHILQSIDAYARGQADVQPAPEVGKRMAIRAPLYSMLEATDG